MIRKLRLAGAMFLLPWLLIAAIGPRFANASPVQLAGPQTFTILNGNGIHTDDSGKPSWQGQNFYPNSVTINVGDSVVWKHNAGGEPHTVTFLGPLKLSDVGDAVIPDPDSPPGPGGPPKLIFNPKHFYPAGGSAYDGSAYTSSGFMADNLPGPKEYTLTFNTPGTYQYLCLLHGGATPDGVLVGMVGTVTVQAAGSAYPMTPEQVMAAGKQKIDADAAMARQLQSDVEKQAKPDETMPDGSTKHYVTVGYMDMMHNLDYQRFINGNLTVKTGDTVEFAETMPNFHTVTFTSGGPEPDLLLIEPQKQGPPKLVANPLAIFPSGGNVYTGKGYYNSGILAAPDAPEGSGLKVYSLKFTQPGRYEYICIPHDVNGMSAYITVTAAGGTVGMPRTGQGGGTDWVIPATLAGLMLAMSGVALRVRRSKAGKSA